MAERAYFDTSVVVKRYVNERGAVLARHLLRTYRIFSSVLAPLEALSTFARRRAAGELSETSFRAIMMRISTDRRQWELVGLTALILVRAEEVVERTRYTRWMPCTWLRRLRSASVRARPCRSSQPMNGKAMLHSRWVQRDSSCFHLSYGCIWPPSGPLRAHTIDPSFRHSLLPIALGTGIESELIAMIVQIYSMTNIDDAVATAEAGADFIGVVVGEPGVLAEAINSEAARAILAAIRPRARGVALSLSDNRDEICAMVDAVQPDILHVAARGIEPEDCAWLRSRVAPVRLLRAIAVRAGETVAEAQAHQESIDYLMLESGAKGLPFAGGETHDWLVSRIIVEQSRIPVILAGGLSADNIENAIATVRPWGVDSFTHTDLPGQRGRKDLARVRTFIANALRGFAAVIEPAAQASKA